MNCQTSLMQSLAKNNGELFLLFCLKAKDDFLEFCFVHLTSPKKG